MNSKTTPGTSPEKIESKCPISKIRLFFNESLKTILDNVILQRRKLRYLESVTNKSIEGLEKIRWEPYIRMLGIHLNQIEIDQLFAATVSRILNYEDERVAKLIGVAIVDILFLMLAHKNLGIDKQELLKMIPKSMTRVLENEEEKENGDIEKKQTLIQDLIYEFVFISNLEDWKLILYIKEVLENHGEKGRVCPYYYADRQEKNKAFQAIWQMLENQFLPALQEIYKDRENLTKEELFYLGRYNELKK